MSFQPFAVQCLTCGSQLRVNDPSIVGSIATCPKCQSMVEIQPPEKEMNADGADHSRAQEHFDSQAITEEAINVDNDSNGLGLAPPTVTGFSSEFRTDISPPEGSEADTVSWQSEGTRRKRQLGLIVAISVVSLLVCLAGFAWFISVWQGDQQTVRATDKADAIADSLDQSSAEANSVTDSDQQSESTVDTAERIEHAADETSDTEPNSQQPVTESKADSAGQQPDTSEPSVQEPVEPTIPSDLIPVSPMEEMPETNDSAPPETGSSGLQDLPPGLEQYTRFLLEEGPVERTNLEAPPSMDDLDIDEATQELASPIAPLRPKKINVEAAFAIQLAVNSDGYAIPELTLLISQITGIPIQIDWVSFDLGNIDLSVPQKLPEGWKSAKELLQAACEGVGAEIRNEENFATITLSDASFQKVLDEITVLGDFPDNGKNTQDLVLSFLSLKKTEDAQWLSSESRKNQQLAAIVIEALRRMRAMPSKVEDPYFSRWVLSPENNAISWTTPVNGKSFPQSDLPMTVAEFLLRLSKENGVQTLINWQDFTDRRVNPERVFLPYSGESAAITISKTLEPLGLEARQVDSKHWWIGQRSTYDRLPVVVWTKPLSQDSTLVLQQLQSMLSQTIDASLFRVTFDEVSSRAILVLPRYLAEQLPKFLDGIPGGTPQTTTE